MTGKKEAYRAVPILKFYPNGGTSGTPPGMSKHKRAKRKAITGWTPKAARNQKRWFYSVNVDKLTGHGFSATLTVRDCPDSAADFHKARRALMKRLQRMGLIRAHWLVEWQRRGVPHLHGCFYFDDPNAGYHVPIHWLEVAHQFGAGPLGQDIKPIYAVHGWLQYLAKHGARGVAHYQRANKNRPAGWEKTGRMWGYVGDWPIEAPFTFHLEEEGYWIYRRLVRAWSVANARAEGDARRIRYTRSMLKAADIVHGRILGTSEWVPQHLNMAFIGYVASLDYEVIHQPDENA